MRGEERLRCAVCSKEVRVVRLGRSLLTLGHRSNPGPKHHLIRLAAPSAALGRSGSRFEDTQGQRGAPRLLGASSRAGVSISDGASTDAAVGLEGSAADRTPSAASRIPRRGASALGANPPGLDVRAPAPSAGRSTAGGTG